MWFLYIKLRKSRLLLCYFWSVLLCTANYEKEKEGIKSMMPMLGKFPFSPMLLLALVESINLMLSQFSKSKKYGAW